MAQLPTLSHGAKRWLVGADPHCTSSITRWRYLIARRPSRAQWEEFLADFWNEFRDVIVERHIARWPGTRPQRWWDHVAPVPLPPDESKYEFLRRHRLLLPEEKRWHED